IEADVFADGIAAGPIVFREMLIHDSDTRRILAIGSQEGAATYNRNAHCVEVRLINGIHCRSKVHAIARHLKTVRHEGDVFEFVQSEGRVLRKSRALNSRRQSHTLDQEFIELLRLSCVVLDETRVESCQQEMIFRESG